MRGWSGTRVDPLCPQCGGECEYNGNYFCSEDGCGWALSDLYDGAPNAKEWSWFLEAYKSLMQRDGVEPDAEVISEAKEKIKVASKSRSQLRIEDALHKVLPKVATMGITDGWDAAIKALQKSLAVFDMKIVEEAATGPVGPHPHGMKETWRADGKCIVKSCNHYKSAKTAEAAAIPSPQPAVANMPATAPPPKPEYRAPVVRAPESQRSNVVTHKVSINGSDVYTLPDGEIISVTKDSPSGLKDALARLEELGIEQEFWSMDPTPDEVVGYLNHVLGLAT